jgi:hypothetical protein
MKKIKLILAIILAFSFIQIFTAQEEENESGWKQSMLILLKIDKEQQTT